MKKLTTTIIKSLSTLIILSLLFGCTVSRTDEIETGFLNPPDSAKPRTWWHWMNGNVTKEGITADLEAIKKAGIGGVQVFDVKMFFLGLSDPDILSERVDYMSPEWLEMLKYAANECVRLGLEMTMNTGSGWSTAGGPWVKPEGSMQKLVWSETRFKGPAKISSVLPTPPDVFGPFQDIKVPLWEGFHPPIINDNFFADYAVIAYRLPPSIKPSMLESSPNVTTSLPSTDISVILQNSYNTIITFPPLQHGGSHYIQLEFNEPFTCNSLTIMTTASDWELETGNDGKNFTTVLKPGPLSKFKFPPDTYVFEKVTSKFYRLNIKDKESFDIRNFRLNAEAKINRWEVKAGFDMLLDYDQIIKSDFSSEQAINPEEVMDITKMMDSNGLLNWDVPEGDWVVLRLGRSSTGRPNWPATPKGIGLECDKLSREAVHAFYNGLMDPVKEVLGPLVGTGLKYLLIDSWESNHLNWTPEFTSEFRNRRGYDPTPYLPAMTGVMVGNAEISDRFLRDIRRTIADLIADNFYGGIQESAHLDNMGLYAEALGLNQPWISDQLKAKGQTDIPMGEFWIPTHPGFNSVNSKDNEHYCDPKEAASAAHIYGKKIAATESFTSGGSNHWALAPFWLKAYGDYYYTLGINRFIMHTYAHQPVDDKKPGMTLGIWGQHFGRHATWWENGAPEWIKYLSRCQFLLQQGLFQADVLYYYGDDAPATAGQRDELIPGLPYGYDYDICNTEVLLERISVKKGRISLPDGMSYAVLVLPDDSLMIPSVANKIMSLVKNGATVIGPKPMKSPGLFNYPDCDTEVAKIGSEVWGNCNGKNITMNKYGKGRVIWGKTLTEVFEDMKLNPDFTFKSIESDSDIGYIHRKDYKSDMYFVQNRLNRPQKTLCSFRVTGKQPELWHPDNGKIEKLSVFTEKDGLTHVPIHFDNFGSVFVIFREKAGKTPVLEVKCNGKPVISAKTLTSDLDQPEIDQIHLALSDVGNINATVFDPGNYEFILSDGSIKTVEVPQIAAHKKIEGPWELSFPKNWGAPESVKLDSLISWTKHPQDGIKYFSGTAVYQKVIEVSVDTENNENRIYLDLGNVKEIAEIKLNGNILGTLWKPPFCIDITSAVQQGKNDLEIKITNLWPNRLIGDQNLPKNERFTWTSFPPYRKDHPLFDSGLIGPVYLKESKVVEIN